MNSLGSTHQWNRYAFFAAAIPALALTWLACSSSSSAPPAPPPGDAGPPCPTQNCPNGEACCSGVGDGGEPTLSCQTSCPGPSVVLCTAPSDCPASASICCANIDSIEDQNAPTGCSVTGASSRCQSACVPAFGVPNCNPSVTKFCKTSSDCGGVLGEEGGAGDGGSVFSQCCDLNTAGGPLAICVPAGSSEAVNCH